MRALELRPAALGWLAEQLAACLVSCSGYRVIRRNFRAPGGEVDLIAQRRELLVFVEVRLRRNTTRGDGLASVGADKQQRIVQTAERFIARHPAYAHHQVRFDVMSFGQRNYCPTLRWIKRAFELEPHNEQTAFSL